MKVKLIHYTPLDTIALAGYTCTDKVEGNPEAYQFDSSEHNTFIKRLIDRGHESVIEHCYYTFYIEGVSRAALQEIARHRMASYSVKSTRYTLKQLTLMDDIAVRESFVHTGYDEVDVLIYKQLLHLRELIKYRLSVGERLPNDRLKYALPEAFKTTLQMTVNARSLRNFLKLRTSPAALWEMQALSNELFQHIPMEHRFMFTDILQ